MRPRPGAFPLLLLGVGCVNEYHPEYHPVTHMTYVQNVSYPTYVYQAAPPPPSRRAPPGARPTEASVTEAPAVALTPRAAPSAKGAGRALASVVTRMRRADAVRLFRERYARFVVHPTADTESRDQELAPLAAWGGAEFDVRPDPRDPDVAFVRFDVWRPASVAPGTPVVVATSSRGDDRREVIVSYGAVEGDPAAPESVADAR